GYGVAHFAGRTIGDVTNWIDRFARRSGGDEKCHAISLSFRVRRNSARNAISFTFHNRPSPSYPHASIPFSGPINSAPPALRLSTLSCVAGCAHSFPFIAGAIRIGARVASVIAASG